MPISKKAVTDAVSRVREWQQDEAILDEQVTSLFESLSEVEGGKDFRESMRAILDGFFDACEGVSSDEDEPELSAEEMLREAAALRRSLEADGVDMSKLLG